MLSFLLTLMRTMRREDGQDMAEYALLVGLIAVAMILMIYALRNTLSNAYYSVVNNEMHAAARRAPLTP